MSKKPKTLTVYSVIATIAYVMPNENIPTVLDTKIVEVFSDKKSAKKLAKKLSSKMRLTWKTAQPQVIDLPISDGSVDDGEMSESVDVTAISGVEKTPKYDNIEILEHTLTIKK